MALKDMLLSEEGRAQNRIRKRQFTKTKNIERSLEVLEKTISVLDMHKIEYYLDFGTLLGAVRDNGLIPWDHDIDISIWKEEDYYRMPEVMEDLRKEGMAQFIVKFYRSIINRKRRLKRKKLNDIYVEFEDIHFTDYFNYRMAEVCNKRWVPFKKKKGRNCMDIFFKYNKNNRLYWMAENRVHSIPASSLGTELIEIDFYHLKCKIPKNYDTYLTAVYGDWKTPDPSWTEDSQATDFKTNVAGSKNE